ncbi:MAG: aspartyl/asparaginyl beta-hydroxylase domain-containing protein [Pseudomonadota bacterium]|nr:aspartyl/asparaginyl beta-hydroxylase domain-containing protein [Pseudomonadota bacterium]
MYFDGEFRHIGTIDPQPLARVIESLGDGAWQEYVRRQERFTPHRQTQTIPLLYDDDMRHADPTAWPRFEQFETVLEPVLDTIRKANPPATSAGGEGYFVRIILTRMGPGAVITPHRDHGPSMLRSHRCHLAITTNPLVEFGIENRMQHFAAGEIWEINNRKYHAVRNLGEDSRTHLILDYVVPGEEIQDPDDGLVIA